MPRGRKFVAADCETDPFQSGRVPVPFMWGLYDGKEFQRFDTTEDFVRAIAYRKIIVYAHNGGKFDFMFLLPFIEETRANIINGRIVSMYLGNAELRCSYAAVPESMKSIQKTEIEYWKLERKSRADHMTEIVNYLRDDCVYLYNLMASYREQAGTRKTIASNALAYAKKLGIDPGKTPHSFDRQYRPFFFGGRCQCLKPGTHRNVQLLDIHSAYPYAMQHDHATGGEFYWRADFHGMERDEIARSFITLECTSHGAFPKRVADKREPGLSFPHEYDEYKVTGWEYLAAKDCGLISDEKIIEVRYSPVTINFAPYVDYWFAYKQAHPKAEFPIEYTIGKIMMNSLYGKLAQNPERYYDYKILHGGSEIDENNGWELFTEFGSHEIHRRETLWKYKYQYDKEKGVIFSNGHTWEGKPLYINVATGASITGFTRAHLLRAMCALGMENVLYCDTDGIVADARADISALPLSDALGDWGFEGTGHIGHFCGKKLYGIKGINEKGKAFEKIACKGSKLTWREIERIMAGETVIWNNEAPTFAIDGSARFIQRAIRATAQTPMNA